MLSGGQDKLLRRRGWFEGHALDLWLAWFAVRAHLPYLQRKGETDWRRKIRAREKAYEYVVARTHTHPKMHTDR